MLRFKKSVFPIVIFFVFSNNILSQSRTFDCSILWEKLQASNQLNSRASLNSEKYFYEEYCNCIKITNDTVNLNKFKYITELSAFSGGYALKITPWYSAIIDSNFNEISKTINKYLIYLGHGYYTEKSYGKTILFDRFGIKIPTPKEYKKFKVLKNSKSDEVLFIGQTGLNCDVFSIEGKIIKSFEDISNSDVISDNILLLYRNIPPKSEFDLGYTLQSLYSADLKELMPFMGGKFKKNGNQLIFISDKNEALFFDDKGNLIKRQLKVNYLENNNELVLVTEIDGKWMFYNNEKGVFDSLISHSKLNELGYKLYVHPKNYKGILIKNLKFQSIFTNPIFWINHLHDNWFIVYDGSSHIIWNAKTNQKINKPKNYMEAKALSIETKSSLNFTSFPFLFDIERLFNDEKQIQSKNLTIYKSYNYDTKGVKKELIRQDFHWDFTSAHLVVENGWCYNYNTHNQIVDSFQADGVTELISNNLLEFNIHPEFIPLSYSLDGKYGLFYLSSNIHSPAKFDEIISAESNLFKMEVVLNEKHGVIDAFGNILVPIDYSILYTNNIEEIDAYLEDDQGQQIRHIYSLNSDFTFLKDSSYSYITSLNRKLIVKHPNNTKNLEKGLKFEISNDNVKPYYGELFIELPNKIYRKNNNGSNGIKLYDNEFRPLIDVSIYQYCFLPCGIFTVGNYTKEGNGFYSFKNKNFEPMEIGFQINESDANQLIGRRENDFILINSDGSSIVLPSNYNYKTTNYDGLIYYSEKSNESFWGLMRSDGTKLTELLFDKVFNFDGEHGIVWKNDFRFYIDKNGKTQSF